MQNCKSIVTIVYECYFFNQLLHCIGMACIIMYVCTRSKRVNKKNLGLPVFDIGTACIITQYGSTVYIGMAMGGSAL